VTEPLYYESHVTIEPVFDDRLEELRTIARGYKFYVADLLMRKRAADSERRSAKDSFATSRDHSRVALELRMRHFIDSLRGHGFQVWRAKIEAALYDERWPR
jgi:hypothetical protein